jgi:hypothetical protein
MQQQQQLGWEGSTLHGSNNRVHLIAQGRLRATDKPTASSQLQLAQSREHCRVEVGHRKTAPLL